MKHYLKILSLPLIFLVAFSSLFVIWKIAGLPPPEELTRILEVWFDKYGLPALFLASIIEGVLLVGGYFPGVFVIFFGIVLADSVGQAIEVVLVATIGLFIAHMFNYALGKYGWYRLLVRFGLREAIEHARERVEKRGPVAILSSYWLPSLAALTDTAAGIIQMSFKKFVFYSFISVVAWDAIIGILVYSFKDFAISVSTPGSIGGIIIYSAIIIWIIVIFITDFRQSKQRKSWSGS